MIFLCKQGTLSWIINYMNYKTDALWITGKLTRNLKEGGWWRQTQKDKDIVQCDVFQR